ncbi:MAG: hypothetical protein ACC707_08565 [Thiohalomonadales bacterium]
MKSRIKKKSTLLSRTLNCVIVSLLVSLTTLGVIVGMKVEMKGPGAYLYLLAIVGAVIYIVSTVIFVLLSARQNSSRRA